VLLGVAVGVPLGVAAHRHARLGVFVLAAVGLMQTLPSLALLAFLIALMGTIGFAPALVALFLYALLPIVRNTQAGLHSVSRGLREAARALGLRDPQVLRLVELPLALPTLLAGVTTAEMYDLNPAYHRWATDPTGPHMLLVPVESADAFRESLLQLTPDQRMRVERYTARAAFILGVGIAVLATAVPVRDAMKVVPAKILRGE